MNTLRIKCIQANFIMGNQKLYRLYVHMWYMYTASHVQLLNKLFTEKVQISSCWRMHWTNIYSSSFGNIQQNLLHAGELLLS